MKHFYETKGKNCTLKEIPLCEFVILNSPFISVTMLPSLESFKKTSPEKIFIFFLVSLLSGGFLLFSPPESLIILFFLSAIFFSGAVFVGFLIPNAFIALGFPFVFFLLSQAGNMGEEFFWASILLGIAGFFTSITISQNTKNAISLRFLRTSITGISAGFLFFLVGVLLLMLTNISLSDAVKSLTTENKTMKIMTEKIINQMQESGNNPDIQKALQGMMMQQLEPKIQALCEGNAQCITKQKKAVKKAMQERLQETDNEKISQDQKDAIAKNIENSLQEKFSGFLDPKNLKESIAEYNISFLQNISGEALQKIILIIILSLMILPFTFLFSWAFACIHILIFLIFLSTGIIKMNTKQVLKEVLY